MDHIIEHGTNFRVERRANGAIFRPFDDCMVALQRFQLLVDDLKSRQGDGYAIEQTHRLSGKPEDLVDHIRVSISAANQLARSAGTPSAS